MIIDLFESNDIRILQWSVVHDFPLNMFIHLHHQKKNIKKNTKWK